MSPLCSLIRSHVILHWKWDENFVPSIFWMGAGSGPCRIERPSITLLQSVIKISKMSTHVLVYQLGQNVEENTAGNCTKYLFRITHFLYFFVNRLRLIFPNIYWCLSVSNYPNCFSRSANKKSRKGSSHFFLKKYSSKEQARSRLNCKKYLATYFHLIPVSTDRSFCSIIPPSLKCLKRKVNWYCGCGFSQDGFNY